MMDSRCQLEQHELRLGQAKSSQYEPIDCYTSSLNEVFEEKTKI
jgi:hypothetical protein